MTHVRALRISLLVSLGLVPVACGGTVRNNPDDDSSGGTGAGGSSPTTNPKPGSAGKPGSGVTSGTGGVTSGTGGVTSGTGGALPIAGTSPTTPPGGATSTGGSGGATLVASACTNPQRDAVTGLVQCEEGYRHRPSAKTCELPQGAPAPGEGGAGGAEESGPRPRADGTVLCESNPSVCDAFELGYCDGAVFAACFSGCAKDADCGEHAICLCGAPSTHGGSCVSTNCQTDADCAPGYLCASYQGICGTYGFACQKPDDECQASSDCDDARLLCEPDSSKMRRVCALGAACGRPFLIEAEARVAPVVASRDWSALAEAMPAVEHLTATERAVLAEHWTRLGQLEHASIAAFARFSLQLLSLGAPPELVEACTRALADETAHTRLCFRLASAYAGRAIGPGPLDIARSLEAVSLSDIVDLVIAEGCFGETSAALEALDAADSASDPVVAAAYAQIAADEQRHAELAFQFVRWALGRERHGTAQRIAAAISSPPRAVPGVVSVAVPCLQALLAA